MLLFINYFFQKPTSEVEVLKKQQENILTQLRYLKDQMLTLKDELSKKGSKSSTALSCSRADNITQNQAVKKDLQWVSK